MFVLSLIIHALLSTAPLSSSLIRYKLDAVDWMGDAPQENKYKVAGVGLEP